MEKFSQFRDRGSGVAPFLPIPTEPSGIYLPFHVFLFMIRMPLLLGVSLGYFLFLQWLPIGSLGKKASLWSILGVPGIWWIDLQIDGVRRGSLAQHNARLPREGNIIASSSATPIDALYLAAIFDPVFTASYPNLRLVEPISLFQAMLRAFLPPQATPGPKAHLVDLETLLANYPNRVIVVFPECTTSNGRAILPLSPSLLSAPIKTKVFPVSLRYTPSDITTPVPGAFFTFFWNLCSKPTHCIRIRIAEAVYNNYRATTQTVTARTTGTSTPSDLIPDGVSSVSSDGETLVAGEESESPLSNEEKGFLDKVSESLARLGRAKRVSLGVKEKQDFLVSWTKARKR